MNYLEKNELIKYNLVNMGVDELQDKLEHYLRDNSH